VIWQVSAAVPEMEYGNGTLAILASLESAHSIVTKQHSLNHISKARCGAPVLVVTPNGSTPPLRSGRDDESFA
jgi:hypothetical protein